MSDIIIYAILIALGIVAGVLSGTMGIGGGLVIIPSLVFILGMTQKEAQGTSLAFMIPPIGIFAALNYTKHGHINWKYAMILSLFFTIGALWGSKIAMQFDEKILKRIFGFFMLFVAIRMIISK